MPSQQKLIKQGIKYTDSLFDEIRKRLEKGVRASDTLEDFLVKYNEAFPDKGNPVISLGYDAKMLDLILKETNNHKFSRPAQKELVRVTIENQVGDLIVDVGEDIRQSVRDIVQEGYNNNLSQDEIAENISNRVSVIKNKRARAIARTEIARTATISDYVINRERGATHFYVECRNTACPICKEAWHNNWSKANDETFKPNDSSAGGKGWIGDRVYSMNNTQMLPPIHVNCRCVPYFISEDEIPTGATVVKDTTTTTTTVKPTEAQIKENLTPEEQAQYNRTLPRDIENYRKSAEVTFKDDAKLVKLFTDKLKDAEAKLNELTQKALGNIKTETKEFTISPIEGYDLTIMKNDVPIEDKTFDKLMNWSYKRATKNKIEYGYQFDTDTGELLGKEVRGKKGEITFTQQGTNIGSFHTHPPVEGDVGGGSFPSKQDIKVYRSQKGADHLIGSPTEIWYIHAEENLNSSVLGQREIDKIYDKVYKEVTEKGQKLVKEGKLKTDDDSLRKFLDKEIGDGLLREFNTPEWQEKGFYIRRAYR